MQHGGLTPVNRSTETCSLGLQLVLLDFLIMVNRSFPHSSQPHARKHESEARVDNNQTWRRTVRVLRLVVVVSIAACLTAKVLFTATKGIEMAFHFFLSLWKPKLKIVEFWL